jgi:signal transduction histidine kinase
VKILDEALDGLGRWYIALPPLLLVGFLTGLFFLAIAGQTRLQLANELLHVAQLRQQALSDYLTLIRDAETSQRDYLLTGDTHYLAPYRDALPKLELTLDHMQQAYGDNPSALASIAALRSLTGKKLGEVEATLALYRAQGAGQAIQLVRTDFGKKVMEDIRRTVRGLQDKETQQLAAATSGWRKDLRATRWLTAAGAALNIILVLVAFRLVYNDMRRRIRQATELRDQKHELEKLVDERTKDLATLSTNLLSIAEREKSALARELHDELGGLLVASRMDLSWVERHLPPLDSAVQKRVKRIHENLNAGVDLKRRIVEDLHPTLLDNMGLYAALRWQFKESCGRSGLKCTETYPHEELEFTPEASIAVFRVLQEAITNILKHAEAKAVDVAVDIDDQTFTLRITDDGKGIARDRLKAVGSHGLASMRHRITTLGGTFNLQCPTSGGTILTARIPLSRALMAHQLEPEAQAAP